jgi:tRNA pseudouridine13 synthase
VFEIPEWPFALGPPGATGLIRRFPEDFVVEEIPRISAEGDGSHLWLWVEKRNANTDWVARELARVAGCGNREVGYAGLKDRRAITRQWFSVPLSDTARPNLEETAIEGVHILEIHRHTRKLKRGTLDGNRFQLKIREFKGDIAQTEQRLGQVRANGVPNYFGAQRFGRLGRNVEQGFRLLEKGGRLQRNKRSIYLSAIRSFLFNHVLAERVRKGTWSSITDGELAMLEGTRSVFPCELPDSDIEDRCRSLDIHPTGPMPGSNGTQPARCTAELEQSVLQHWPELMECLVAQRVQASRRALRVIPTGFEWDFGGGDLRVSFVLPPGAYATTVLRELLVIRDGNRKSDLEQARTGNHGSLQA